MTDRPDVLSEAARWERKIRASSTHGWNEPVANLIHRLADALEAAQTRISELEADAAEFGRAWDENVTAKDLVPGSTHRALIVSAEARVRQLEEEKTDLKHGLADETAMHELQKRVAARLRDRVLQREEALRLARNLAQGAADLAREALSAKENTREGDTMARLEMDELRPVIRGLDTVRVKKEDLLAALKENKEEHRRIFTEAIDAWHKRVIERLEGLVAQAKRGPDDVDLVVRLPRPADHTKDYERVIKMIELSQDDEFELTQNDFAQFVMDDWGWQREFLATSGQFSELANVKMDKQGYR